MFAWNVEPIGQTMIKDLLLVVDASQRSDPMIPAAVARAEQLSARLTIEILSANPLLVPWLEPATAMYVPEVDVREADAARHQAVTAMTSASKAVVRVIGLHDDLSMLARRAGKSGPVVDLILMGDTSTWESAWLRKRTAETIVMCAGSPLLVLSAAMIRRPMRHAVLGWKDTAEARRVIHDIVAMVEPGGTIDVLTVGVKTASQTEAGVSANEVVRHLSHHGFIAEAHGVADDTRNDAQALEGFALERGADVLAIGAFGHSRAREVIFGGVTQSLIEASNLPVLMSR